MSDDSGEGEEVGLPDKLYFRIGEVAELVGVEPHVLRYWETEFRMRPHRSSSGQRLYRRQDIARFLKVKKLLHNEGFTIAGARKALAPQAAGRGAEPSTASAPASTADVERLREAAQRIEAVRARVAALRRELAERP